MILLYLILNIATPSILPGRIAEQPPAAIAAATSAQITPQLSDEVLDEINFARMEPRRYAQTLLYYRRYFDGMIVRYPGNEAGVITTEGVRAVDDAIAFLERQAALPPLTPSDLLALAAKDHVLDLGPKGMTGHRSSKDGASPSTRLQRHGGGAYVAEIITFGPPSAIEVVRQWIVNDGNPNRGHRKSVFAAEMNYAGVSCGAHRTYRVMCVAGLGRTEDGKY